MRLTQAKKYNVPPKGQQQVLVVDGWGKLYKRFETPEECINEMLIPERNFWFVINREFKMAANKPDRLQQWRENNNHEQHNLSVHGWQLFWERDFPNHTGFPTMMTFSDIHIQLENYINNIHSKEIEEVMQHYDEVNAKLAPKISYDTVDIDYCDKQLNISKPKPKEEQKIIVYKSPKIVKDGQFDELDSKALW